MGRVGSDGQGLDLQVGLKTIHTDDEGPIRLIEDVELRVRPGEVVGIVGPSGAGKTTLLRIILALEEVDAGHMRWNGAPPEEPNPEIQAVFQDNKLLPWKTVLDNIRFVSGEDSNRIPDVLEMVGLKDKTDDHPAELSGGEKTRVAMARALVNPPGLLLLDEPFRGIDLVRKWHIEENLSEFFCEQEIAVVMVSHNVRDAVYLSDRVHVMSGNPMTQEKTIPVNVPRPRNRDNSTHSQDLDSAEKDARDTLSELWT